MNSSRGSPARIVKPGYRPSPTPLEVFAYFAYLIPVVAIYIWTDRSRQATRPATA